MPRPHKCRQVRFEPTFRLFKPQGVPARDLPTVLLTIDELEALRLRDLEGLPQEEIATQMGISQSTVQRILTTGHRKIVEAVVRGKSLQIEGGAVTLSSQPMRQFRCLSCQHVWEVAFGTGQRGRDMDCPACGRRTAHRISHGTWQAEKTEIQE